LRVKENDADSGVIALYLILVLEHADIAVHLADVLMREAADFEIEQHKTLENEMIEDQIDVEILVLEA